MNFQMKLIAKKTTDRINRGFQIRPITGDYHEVVGIPSIAANTQDMLHKLVELIHVDVRKELRCEIADR